MKWKRSVRYTNIVDGPDCQFQSRSSPWFDPPTQWKQRGGRWSSVKESTKSVMQFFTWRFYHCSLPGCCGGGRDRDNDEPHLQARGDCPPAREFRRQVTEGQISSTTYVHCKKCCGSVTHWHGAGCGSRRPKNIRIRSGCGSGILVHLFNSLRIKSHRKVTNLFLLDDGRIRSWIWSRIRLCD